MAYANIGTVFAEPLAKRNQRPSLFKRIIDAMIESRMRSAQRQINAHAHLLRGRVPLHSDTAAARTVATTDLPFTG